jgi:uncharacterized membrane protein YfcA
MPDLDAILFATIMIFFVANLVQGFTGFGVAIVAMTGLTLVGGVLHATVLTNLGALVAVAAVLARLWGHVSWRHVWPLMLGIVAGTPVGLAFLKLVGSTHPDLVRRLLGSVIIVFAAWSLLGRSLRPQWMRWQVAMAAGVMGGVLSGAFTMAGPPLVAYVYSLPVARDTLKASANACFVFSTTYRLALIIAAGDVTCPILVQFAVCVPVILLGVVAGMLLARRVSTERFRRIAWMVFGLLGVLLMAR